MIIFLVEHQVALLLICEWKLWIWGFKLAQCSQWMYLILMLLHFGICRLESRLNSWIQSTWTQKYMICKDLDLQVVPTFFRSNQNNWSCSTLKLLKFIVQVSMLPHYALATCRQWLVSTLCVSFKFDACFSVCRWPRLFKSPKP